MALNRQQRVVFTAQEIQNLIAHRVLEIRAVKECIEELRIRPPVRTAPDAHGCNWTIEIGGIPIEADAAVRAVIRTVRSYVNLPRDTPVLAMDRSISQRRKHRIAGSITKQWQH
jgi:hypothetical protein